MQPNEFQARLRRDVTRVAEKAREQSEAAGEFLSRLRRICRGASRNDSSAVRSGSSSRKWNAITKYSDRCACRCDYRFKRAPLPEEHVASATPTPASSRARAPGQWRERPKLVERNVVRCDVFLLAKRGAPVVNQIASANQQFFIIRTLHVLNEKDKGPARAQATTQRLKSKAPRHRRRPRPAAKSNAALNFIVGNEKIQTTASIEIVRFTF